MTRPLLLIGAALLGAAACRTTESHKTPATSSPQPSQRIVVDDPLQGSARGTVVGGELTAEGYRPGSGCNHLLYEFPTVNQGAVEFEVKGMSNLTDDIDHGFFGMYDGRGVTEPATYFPDFRENFFRWNVHWRGEKNAIKSVLNLAEPKAERTGAARAVFKGGDPPQRDWVKEPNGSTVAWSPDSWHRFRIEWGGREHRVLVDGQVVWKLETPYDYAPVVHRAWLGSAPCNGQKYANHVPEIVYRNFRVTAL